MNDLKEIGGFIVSADPYVNHDNSLSGNGTLTSPLGVVPGYNETKLFVAPTTAGSNVRPITLSEPYTNFERLKIYFRINDWDAGCSECMSYDKQLDLITQSNYGPSSPDNNYSKGIRMYLVNDNQLSAAPSAFCFYINTNKQFSYFNEAYSVFYINEVIGINRKQ